MNLLYLIFSYERPKILSYCLSTLYNNNSEVRPNYSYILDDCSNPEIKKSLLDLTIKYSTPGNPISLIVNGKNMGVGWQFELGFRIMEMIDPTICLFCESDYIFRRGAILDMLAVFESSEHTMLMSPVSHPDMYDRIKTHTEFPKLMQDQFGADVLHREWMYKPYNLKTKRGNILVQKISNTCGTHVLHWERVKQYIFKELGKKEEYYRWMERAWHKWGTNFGRNLASDAHLSGTVVGMGEQWAIKNNIDLQDYAAALDICDASPAEHVCGGLTSINGKICDEGQTFIRSPVWYEKYLEIDPRALSDNKTP